VVKSPFLDNGYCYSIPLFLIDLIQNTNVQRSYPIFQNTPY
jgi:hypothetical protein